MAKVKITEITFLVTIKVPPGMDKPDVEREVTNSISFGQPKIRYLYSTIQVEKGERNAIRILE